MNNQRTILAKPGRNLVDPRRYVSDSAGRRYTLGRVPHVADHQRDLRVIPVMPNHGDGLVVG